MKYFLPALLLLFVTITTGQVVEVHYNKSSKQAYLVHTVAAQETMYGIAKRYGLSVEGIKAANRSLSHDLSIGQQLIIPWETDHYTYHPGQAGTPIVYRVRKKDNLFRICRRYLDRDIERVQRINRMDDRGLRIHQALIIGYMPSGALFTLPSNEVASTDPSVTPTNDVDISSNNASIKTPKEASPTSHDDEPVLITTAHRQSTSSVSARLDALTMSRENGAAYWDKNDTDLQGAYVLHRHAKPNTWIHLTNPMNDRSINALVVGRLPENRYQDNILVVISPSIAKHLNALDEQFYVKVRYLRGQPTP